MSTKKLKNASFSFTILPDDIKQSKNEQVPAKNTTILLTVLLSVNKTATFLVAFYMTVSLRCEKANITRTPRC